MRINIGVRGVEPNRNKSWLPAQKAAGESAGEAEH